MLKFETPEIEVLNIVATDAICNELSWEDEE